MSRTLVFIVTAFVVTFVTGRHIETIECPIPDGQTVMSETQCALRTACFWTGSICHMRDETDIGYLVAAEPRDTGRGFQVELKLNDHGYSMYDADIRNLIFEVIYHEDYHVQVKIYDRDTARYEVPFSLYLPDTFADDIDRLYEVTVSAIGEPFTFSVLRRNSTSDNTIFKLVGALSFEDQFIQLTTELATTYLYGFGESTHQQFRRVFEPRETYPIFAKDQPVGTEPNMAEYGHHPYYMLMEDDDGNSHSVLYYGSNAMEYSTFYLDDDRTAGLTLRSIGGIVDLHFFLGPTPEQTTMQYLSMIGKPIFPPYSFLGFQISRWGYENTDHIRAVRNRMKQYGIPQDIQVFDIDYMQNYRDFTIDPVNFGDLDVLVNELHEDNIKVTTILDPAIVSDIDRYEPYQRGVEADAFIKWMHPSYIPEDQHDYTRDYVVGYCWPDNKTVYPDFFNPNTTAWWVNEVSLLKQILDFDVMWIDMNEPANFGTDTPRPWNYPEDLPDWSLKCPDTKWDSPPYPTAVTYVGGTESFRLSDHSICMSTVQTDGLNVYNHYDVHSLYGYTHLLATHQAMQQIFPGKRNPILVRSSFPGTGQYGVHWLGDNSATWTHMRMSIWGMFEFNMFGIPYVGADICGFFQDTTEELCMRWMQLGAFYPFSRNHNADGYADQDPAVWESVANVSRQILLFRYKYNPYLYHLFYRAHRYGHTVIRPLLTNWPADILARDIDDQFLWGDGMMVAPVMESQMTQRNVYFPQATWYEMFEGTLITNVSVHLNIDAPMEYIPVYVRGGRILPFQEPALNTHTSRLNPFGLLVALDGNYAVGEIYWDDGDSLYSDNTSYLANVVYNAGSLDLTVERGSSIVDGLHIGHIQIFGFPSIPTWVFVNGEVTGSSQWTYNDTSLVLDFALSSPLGQNLSVQFDTE